jgi:hypothetical protein
LGCFSVWKSLFQHPDNLLVILLPGALEERLIGGVLNQGMFEEVPCLLTDAALVENLRFHEFGESPL